MKDQNELKEQKVIVSVTSGELRQRSSTKDFTLKTKFKVNQRVYVSADNKPQIGYIKRISAIILAQDENRKIENLGLDYEFNYFIICFDSTGDEISQMWYNPDKVFHRKIDCNQEILKELGFDIKKEHIKEI